MLKGAIAEENALTEELIRTRKDDSRLRIKSGEIRAQWRCDGDRFMNTVAAFMDKLRIDLISSNLVETSDFGNLQCHWENLVRLTDTYAQHEDNVIQHCYAVRKAEEKFYSMRERIDDRDPKSSVECSVVPPRLSGQMGWRSGLEKHPSDITESLSLLYKQIQELGEWRKIFIEGQLTRDCFESLSNDQPTNFFSSSNALLQELQQKTEKSRESTHGTDMSVHTGKIHDWDAGQEARSPITAQSATSDSNHSSVSKKNTRFLLPIEQNISSGVSVDTHDISKHESINDWLYKCLKSSHIERFRFKQYLRCAGVSTSDETVLQGLIDQHWQDDTARTFSPRTQSHPSLDISISDPENDDLKTILLPMNTILRLCHSPISSEASVLPLASHVLRSHLA